MEIKEFKKLFNKIAMTLAPESQECVLSYKIAVKETTSYLARTETNHLNHDRRRFVFNSLLIKYGTVEEITDSVVHEFAHCICHNIYPEHECGHGPLWHNVYVSIGGSPEYGKSAVALSDTSVLRQELALAREKSSRYHIICKTCGQTIALRKRHTRNPKYEIHCRSCAADLGDFNEMTVGNWFDTKTNQYIS